MRVYYAHRALYGYDENCADYISYASALPVAGPVTAVPAAAPAESAGCDGSPLAAAIVTGRVDAAAKETKDALSTRLPLELVENEIIPALDKVGQGFENKTVYLPQLLMSAESAKSAFEVILPKCFFRIFL